MDDFSGISVFADLTGKVVSRINNDLKRRNMVFLRVIKGLIEF